MNQPAHILLIEDDPAVGHSLRDGLARDGYRVTWTESGAAGIDYAREHTPHLIVLDVRLPDGSGFDFCRQMRQLGLRQPIIILTVRQDEVDKVLGLEMGADDYVTKPFSLRELLSRIRALLRRPMGSCQPPTRTSYSWPIWSSTAIVVRSGAGRSKSTSPRPNSGCWSFWPAIPARPSAGPKSWKPSGATTPTSRANERSTFISAVCAKRSNSTPAGRRSS